MWKVRGESGEDGGEGEVPKWEIRGVTNRGGGKEDVVIKAGTQCLKIVQGRTHPDQKLGKLKSFKRETCKNMSYSTNAVLYSGRLCFQLQRKTPPLQYSLHFHAIVCVSTQIVHMCRVRRVDTPFPLIHTIKTNMLHV